MWNGKKANFAPRVGMGLESARRRSRHLPRRRRAALRLHRDLVQRARNHQRPVLAPLSIRPSRWAASPIRGRAIRAAIHSRQNGKAYFPTTGGVYINMPINPKPTSVAHWNATYQRQLGKDWLASVSYLGNKTSHLWIARRSQSGDLPGTWVPAPSMASLTPPALNQPPTPTSAGCRCAQPDAGRGLCQHRHHGRRSHRALRRHAAVGQHRFASNFTSSTPTTLIRCASPITTSALHWPARRTRSSSTAMPIGDRASPTRATSSIPRWWPPVPGSSPIGWRARWSTTGNSRR